MIGTIKPVVAFCGGLVVLSLLALFIALAPERTQDILQPFLIGVAGSLSATLAIYLLSVAALGRGRELELLWSQEAIYREARQLVDELVADGKTVFSSRIQVTAMSRKETSRDIVEVRDYMRSLERLLKSIEDDGHVVYKMLGKFGECSRHGDPSSFVAVDDDIQERLGQFSKEAQKRIRVSSYDEIWPVDILVIGTKVIVGFREQNSGNLCWGFKVSSDALAGRAKRWFEELWDDPSTVRIWDGKKYAYDQV